ncbi:MAG TPA: L,D-transpeptidase family protein, partial [Nevskia sp.]|nr:L,D-transpeptidase family protein [Nevskia sp.]
AAQDAADTPLAAQTAAPPSALQLRVEQLAPGGPLITSSPRLSLNEAAVAFYRRRAYAPAWTDPQRVDALIAALYELTLDGLDPEDYRASQIAKGEAALAASAGAAPDPEFELLATRAYLLALTHLYRGKVDPRTVDSGRNFDPASPDPQQALQLALTGVDSSDIAAAFAKARPQHPLYQGLREAMGSLRNVAGEGGWPILPEGPTLKPGDDDPRVPLLRRRLQASGYLPDDLTDETLASTHYDAQLAAAALRYQDEQYLDTDSGVGGATRRALNLPVQARIAQLRVNLERARWLLHEIQGDLVVVDIAGFTLHYFQGEPMPVWSSRVQVGQPYRMTPMFKSAIDQITINPAWVVPPTIYTKDILPKVRKDPGYLAAHKLHAYTADWKELDGARINWKNPPAGLRLRQESGSDGALGHIKISFPNPYAVYLHDTPHAELFARQSRAFSSGCIRLQEPYELAVRLFNDPEHWNRAALDEAVASGATRTWKLNTPVPVLLAYWTVDLHDGSRPAFKADIYGLDGALLKALDRPLRWN